MDLIYHKKVAKQLSSQCTIKRYYGSFSNSLTKVLERIKNAKDFNSLFDLPGNWHELAPQTPGVYSITVRHPFRLVARPNGNSLLILGVDNYHDSTKCIGNYKDV